MYSLFQKCINYPKNVFITFVIPRQVAEQVAKTCRIEECLFVPLSFRLLSNTIEQQVVYKRKENCYSSQIVLSIVSISLTDEESFGMKQKSKKC